MMTDGTFKFGMKGATTTAGVIVLPFSILLFARGLGIVISADKEAELLLERLRRQIYQ